MEVIYNDRFFHKVSLLRFVSIVGVLYIHAENYDQFGFLDGTAGYLAEQKLIGSFEWAVPLFFFLSAFLFFRDFSWDCLLAKWKRRAKTLLLPYLLWNTIYFVLFAVLPRLPFLSGLINAAPAPITVNEIFQSVFLHTYSGFMWFIKTLILLTLCAPVFYALLSKRWVGEGVIALLFAMLLIRPFSFPSVTSLSWRFLFFYALGAYLALRRPELLVRPVHRRLRIALAVCIPLLALTNAFFDNELYSVFMVFCIWYAIDMNSVPESRLFDTSFFVYLMHILVFSVVKKIQYALLPHTQAFMLIAYASVPVFALLVLIPLAFLLWRRLPRAYRFLTGGR